MQFDKLAKSVAARPRLKARVLDEIEAINDRSAYSTPRVAPGRRRADRNGVRCAWWAVPGLGALAAALVMAFWMTSRSPSLAFAEVQAALRGIRTVVMTYQVTDPPVRSFRVFVSADHDLFRSEMDGGAVVIQSRSGKTLTLNPAQMTARITPGAGFGLEGEREAPDELLKSLERVEMASVKSLGTKEFDGRELVGFELLTQRGMQRHVWVDPTTRLPVREEITRLEENPPANDRVVRPRPPQMVVAYEFNVDLADKLFSLDPPEGYQLVDSDEFEMPGRPVPEPPQNLDASDYTIVPGRGIGRARFGMTKQEVIAVLGEPSQTELFGEPSADEQAAFDELSRKAEEEDWDEFRLNRELQRLATAKESFRRSGEALMYSALGFHVMVSDDEGMNAILCWPKGSAFREFVGTTDRGVSMKSARADVDRAYGEPTTATETDGWVSLDYGELGVSFSFDPQGAMKQIQVRKPGNK